MVIQMLKWAAWWGGLLWLAGWMALAPAEGVPVTVTVTVDGVPADALIRVFEGERLRQVEYTDVHAPGEARFVLPPGEFTLQVEHGAGFTALPQRLSLRVQAGAPATLSAELARLLDPPARGYYAADLHAHTLASAEATLRIFGIPNHGATPVDQAVGVQLAADLDVVFISDHNTVSGHEAFARTAEARGAPYLLSEEITTLLWGHFNAYALDPGALVAFDFSKPPGAFFDEARAAGAEMIQVNHPLSAGFGYWFVRNQPQYRDDFDAVEVFNDRFGEDDAQTILELFELWNQGRRLVATGVSDDHDWKEMGTEYGTPRTYVEVDGPLSAAAFLSALKAGRAFATYGPLLFLAPGARPGDTLPPGQPVALAVEVESVTALDGGTLELLSNGRRVQAVALAGGGHSTVVFDALTPAPGWLAVRLLGRDRQVLALTNPLWVAAP